MNSNPYVTLKRIAAGLIRLGYNNASVYEEIIPWLECTYALNDSRMSVLDTLIMLSVCEPSNARIVFFTPDSRILHFIHGYIQSEKKLKIVSPSFGQNQKPTARSLTIV